MSDKEIDVANNQQTSDNIIEMVRNEQDFTTDSSTQEVNDTDTVDDEPDVTSNMIKNQADDENMIMAYNDMDIADNKIDVQEYNLDISLADSEMGVGNKIVNEQEHDNKRTMENNETDVVRSPKDNKNEIENTATNQVTIGQYPVIYKNHINIHPHTRAQDTVQQDFAQNHLEHHNEYDNAQETNDIE